MCVGSVSFTRFGYQESPFLNPLKTSPEHIICELLPLSPLPYPLLLLSTVAEVLGYPFSLACMDGRAGDRWTVKPSSVQPGYTLVGALWVRLGERGQYLQASWLVISSHLSCMLDFFWYLLAGKEARWHYHVRQTESQEEEEETESEEGRRRGSWGTIRQTCPGGRGTY